MKILFVLEYFPPHVGGVETLFKNLTEGLAREWHEIVVVTSHFDPHIPKFEKIGEKISVHRISRSRWAFAVGALWRSFRIARDVDLIHTTTFVAAFPAWILAKIRRKKCVITVHELFGKLWTRFMGWRGFFFQIFEKILFRLPFEKYFCVSRYTMNSVRLLAGIPDKKLCVVYNGLDYEQWSVCPGDSEKGLKIRKNFWFDGKFVGVFFGRAGVSKGLEFFLAAIPEIVQENSDFMAFVICSKKDPRFAFFQKKIVDLKIENFVVWIDSVKYSDLKFHILAGDFVVVPSLVEGFGFAAAEVSALEMPLIVSEVASLPEVVSGKICFVGPSDSAGIAAAVQRVRVGDREEISAKKFLREDMVERVSEEYEKTLGD